MNINGGPLEPSKVGRVALRPPIYNGAPGGRALPVRFIAPDHRCALSLNRFQRRRLTNPNEYGSFATIFAQSVVITIPRLRN